MSIYRVPGQPPFPLPPRKGSNPTRAEVKRRLIWGLALMLAGLIAAAFGFYEVSIWNPEPAADWALLAFGAGVVSFIVGVLICIFAAPQLLDSGNKSLSG